MRRSVSKKPSWLALSLFASILVGCQLKAQAQVQTTEEVTYGKRTAYSVSGWERDLVKADPNLGNFYWNPITKYTQSKGSRRTSRQTVHVSPQEFRSRYMKPIHTQLPTASKGASGTLASSSVSANLKYKRQQGESALQGSGSSENVSAVLSYGNSYNYSSGQGDGYSSRSQKLSVKGEIYKTR
ncbi:MAG TPA: hypothetical protein V6D17_05625 [Candidatus Obscuribacterales bacterium]